MGNYHQFLKFVFENLFKNCILALNPKPWRTSNLFEIVYGGRTLIRECVIAKFADNKSVEYAIILTLLDTYIPLCISIGICNYTYFAGYPHSIMYINLFCNIQVKQVQRI